MNKIVNNIAYQLKGHPFMDILQILESVSLHNDVDNIFECMRLNWGQCILGMISQSRVLTICDTNNQYRYSQMTKQSIVGSIMYFDDNNYLINRTLINKICVLRKERLDIIKSNRLRFDKYETRVLYDEKYNKKVYRGFDRYPRKVKEHIRQFWLDNSRPDPSPSKSIIIDHNQRDNDGNKLREQKRYIKWTYLEFYNMWRTTGGGVDMCNDLECWCIPDKPTFVRERPKEIRFESISDRTVCRKHFNYEQLILTFNITTERRHLCGSRFCENYADNNDGDRCTCNVCINCPLYQRMFAVNSDQLLQTIFCDNGHDFPNYNCTTGMCNNSRCGINIIRGILNNTLCPTFTIRPETRVSYEYMDYMKDTEKRKHHEIKQINTTWRQFIDTLINRVLPDFIEHSDQHQLGHYKRSRLSKHSPERPNKLLLTDIFSSWDYISAIIVRNQVNTANSFSDSMSITFLEIYQIINHDNELILSSHCFLSDCSEGCWNMAVEAAKQYYPKSIERLRTINNVQAKRFINYSDGTTKDFRCTSCLAFIGNIARDNDVFNEWNFTAAEEGKWLHDREGGTITRAAYYLMHTGKVKYVSGRTYTACLIDALREHFSADRFNKVERFFYEIPEKDISNISSPHKTLKGITSYYSLLTFKRDHIFYRPYPCSCDECINYRWGNCKQIDVCGVYNGHNFDPNIPYPTRINVAQLQNLNKRSYGQFNNHNNSQSNNMYGSAQKKQRIL